MRTFHTKIVLLSFFCMSFMAGHAQLPQKSTAEKAALLIKSLTAVHYSPKPINDTFSVQLFKDFINLLDYRRLYFTKEDIEQFKTYQYKLDNEINGESWAFLPLVTDRYKKRLLESEKVSAEILKNPISFTQPMSYQNPNKDTFLFYTVEELKMHWKRWLRYQQLHILFSNYAGQNPDSLKSDAELLKSEADARLKLLNLEKRYVQHALNAASGYEESITSHYFNCITKQFDPHTDYFSKTEFEQFKSLLSADELSFGLDIEEDETGNIVVKRLIPGGPAWKSNSVHKGDIITELKWAGKNTIDINGADAKEVLYIFSYSNTEKLEFGLKKANGLSARVTLKKEKIDNEENSVKGYLLNGTNKVGYIALPGFYTEWETPGGNGCANDVAKEVVKLKEENIEALVLDLRNNGGGSTYEALGLMGIFIDEGPLFMKGNKTGKPVIMKDINRGTIYDGPLLVMINGNSASASEIVASTLQDYRRAFISGSTSFGKATEQIIIAVHSGEPLTNYEVLNSPNFMGMTKITDYKLYRITGASNQLIGVKPDFVFPEINALVGYKESELPNVLPNDKINKQLIYSIFDILPIDTLNAKSKKRINQSGIFNGIEQLNKETPESWKKNKVPIALTMDNFRSHYTKTYRYLQAIEKLSESEDSIYRVSQHKYDKILYEKKVSDAELIENAMENIRKDFYIQESFSILSDYLNQKK